MLQTAVVVATGFFPEDLELLQVLVYLDVFQDLMMMMMMLRLNSNGWARINKSHKQISFAYGDEHLFEMSTNYLKVMRRFLN